jgi:hypothetical protein
MSGLVIFLGGLFGLAGHGIWRAIKPEAEGDRVAEGRPIEPSVGIPDTVPAEWVMAYRADQDG